MSLQTAEQYEENEQYSEAYGEYKKLYDKNPKDMNVLERLGHLALMLDNKNEAAEYYSKILEQDATNTMAYEQLMDIYVSTDKYKYYVMRGNLHSVEHQYEHAINDYKKALANAEEEAEQISTRFVLANLYEQTDNSIKAIDEYLKILDHDNTHEQVYIKLANLYLKEDAPISAVDILERARKEGFDTENIRENLAQLYLRNDCPQKTKELTKNELLKIKAMLELGEQDEAEKLIKKAEDKYKNTGEFYSVKAQYYYTVKDNEKALEAVDEYDKIVKNSPLTYQMRAMIFENKNDEFNAHLNWGRYNLIRKNKDVAINEFLNAFQLNEKDADLINTIAVLFEETGDSSHAMEFWEKLAKLEPSNKKAWEKLADFRESIGDYPAQADYLENVYELDKRNPSVIKKLAQAYEKIKNKPSAIEYYNKYLQVAKGVDDYEKIRQKVAKLENTSMQEDEGLIDKVIKLFVH